MLHFSRENPIESVVETNKKHRSYALCPVVVVLVVVRVLLLLKHHKSVHMQSPLLSFSQCRTAQINNSPPDTVRDIQSALNELERVAAKATQIMARNEQVMSTLSLVERGESRITPAEMESMKASVIPPPVLQSLRKCTTMDEIKSSTDQYTKSSKRQTKADMARQLGLMPIVAAMIEGNGMPFCYRSNLNDFIGGALNLVDSAKVAELLIHLIAETIAKDVDTFEHLKVLCNQIPPIITCERRNGRNNHDVDSKDSSETSVSRTEKEKERRKKGTTSE